MHLSQTNAKNKVQISFDLRLIVILLLIIIVSMFVIWKPWVNKTESGRTITVSGEAKITAEPDQYVFQPSYEFKDTNKDVALAALTKKSNEVVSRLKEIGIMDNKIKVDSDGYNYRDFYFDETNNQYTYTLRPSITISSKDQAQKVQDYLITTSPSGQVSPQTSFSDTKKKHVESKARDEATKDARAKANQSAKNLGFTVTKVKSIDDGNAFGGPVPYMMDSAMSSGVKEAKPASLSIQPGENDLNYTVTVVYYIR